MYDGWFESTSVVKDHIDLTPETSPVHLATYRAGPNDRVLQMVDITRILRKEGVAQGKTESAAQIVLVLGKEGT